MSASIMRSCALFIAARPLSTRTLDSCHCRQPQSDIKKLYICAFNTWQTRIGASFRDIAHCPASSPPLPFREIIPIIQDRGCLQGTPACRSHMPFIQKSTPYQNWCGSRPGTSRSLGLTVTRVVLASVRSKLRATLPWQRDFSGTACVCRADSMLSLVW